MEILRDKDSGVSKFIHDDGSETAIKLSGSFDGGLDLNKNSVDRRKYTVFISCSTGCAMKCNFCHLTIKGSKFKKLNEDEVYENIKEALLQEIEFKPEMKKMYMKLSWMGMGEAILYPEMVSSVTLRLISYFLDKKLVLGFDGVDLATVMPNLKNDNWMTIFQDLDDKLENFPKNPNNKIKTNIMDMSNTNMSYESRSNFRLFYSLHEVDDAERAKIIPNAMPVLDAIKKLKEYSQNNRYNLLLHYIFLDKINDSPEKIKKLKTFLIEKDLVDYEFRVLRYNKVDK